MEDWDKMSELNVEKIMEEIRKEIKEKGYTNDILSFSDVTSENAEVKAETFDYVRFNEELFNLNAIWNVSPNQPIERKRGLKGICVTIFKKFIRKCIRFYLSPIVLQQDSFNATTVRMLNMMNLFVEENMRLSDEVNRLKAEQTALKKEICQLSDKSA